MKKIRKPMSVKKRVIIIASIAVPLLLIGVYVFLSYQAWQTANASSTEATAAIKTAVTKNLAGEKLSASLPDSLQNVLDSYTDSMSREACSLGVLYEWQSSLWFMKDTRTACINSAAATTQLVQSLKTYLAYMNKQIEAAKAIEDTIAAQGTDFAGAATQWTTLASSNALASPDEKGDFAPVSVKAKAVSESIAAAYTAMQEAYTKEDKAAFDTADAAIIAAYAQLPEINSVATAVQKILATKVVDAYKAL